MIRISTGDRKPSVFVLLASVVMLGTSSCGSLEPAPNPDLCDHGCNREQFTEVREYWEGYGNAPGFYLWVRSLGVAQLEWIRQDGANPLSVSEDRLSPGDHLRRAIVLYSAPSDPSDLVSAESLVGFYIDHAERDTDEYAFALLLLSSISDNMTAHSDADRQQSALADMESRIVIEQTARRTLEEQLEQIKQIEQSLLGSNQQ